METTPPGAFLNGEFQRAKKKKKIKKTINPSKLRKGKLEFPNHYQQLKEITINFTSVFPKYYKNLPS